MTRGRALGWTAGAAALVLLAGLPLMVPADAIVVADFTLAAFMGGLSLHLLTGMTGLVSLGPAAFFGIGAYAAAELQPGRLPLIDHALGELPGPLALLAGNANGWPLVLGLLVAGLAAALVALVLVPVALRFRDLYLSIVTLGLLFLASYVFVNWDSLTGGSQGISFGAPAVGGFSFGGQSVVLGAIFPQAVKLYYLWGVIAFLAGLSLWHLGRTRTGRALRAIREAEAVVGSMAIHARAYKAWAFVMSSFLAGMAGIMMAVTTGFSVPQDWNLSLTIQYVTIIVIGGIGTIRGTLLGALFVVGLPALLRTVLGSGAGVFGIPLSLVQQLLYGAAIVAFLLVAPGGLAELLTALVRCLPGRRRRLGGLAGDVRT